MTGKSQPEIERANDMQLLERLHLPSLILPPAVSMLMFAFPDLTRHVHINLDLTLRFIPNLRYPYIRILSLGLSQGDDYAIAFVKSFVIGTGFQIFLTFALAIMFSRKSSDQIYLKRCGATASKPDNPYTYRFCDIFRLILFVVLFSFLIYLSMWIVFHSDHGAPQKIIPEAIAFELFSIISLGLFLYLLFCMIFVQVATICKKQSD